MTVRQDMLIFPLAQCPTQNRLDTRALGGTFLEAKQTLLPQTDRDRPLNFNRVALYAVVAKNVPPAVVQHVHVLHIHMILILHRTDCAAIRSGRSLYNTTCPPV